jgi:hypothetical protein
MLHIKLILPAEVQLFSSVTLRHALNLFCSLSVTAFGSGRCWWRFNVDHWINVRVCKIHAGGTLTSSCWRQHFTTNYKSTNCKLQQDKIKMCFKHTLRIIFNWIKTGCNNTLFWTWQETSWLLSDDKSLTKSSATLRFIVPNISVLFKSTDCCKAAVPIYRIKFS